jgi:hypothetical protein
VIGRSDPLTVSVRSILLQEHFLCFNIMAEPAVIDKMRFRNELHLAWNVPSPGAGSDGEETHARRILCLPTQTFIY